jgi:hypothetical protein
MATIKVLLFIISDAESPGFSVGFVAVDSLGFVTVEIGVVVVIIGKLLQSEGFSTYEIKNDCLVN